MSKGRHFWDHSGISVLECRLGAAICSRRFSAYARRTFPATEAVEHPFGLLFMLMSLATSLE